MIARDLGALVDGRLDGAADILLTGAEVDSRLVRPGDLFVALPGARHDGHEFVGPALRVADGALIRNDAPVGPVPPGKVHVRVPDPLSAYHRMASAERSRRSWSVIGLTGSVGKTTTKEMLRALLATQHTVGASEGNRNSTLGLPAQLLSQPEKVDVFVAELGMSTPGELDVLGAITRPDVLLYTRLAPVHTEFFPDFSALVAAKAELLPHLDDGGTLIINADDPHQATFPAAVTAPTLSYGEGGDVVARRIRSLGLAGSRFTLTTPDGSVEIELPLVGGHQVENFVAASTAAWSAGIGLEQIASVAAELQAPARRGRIHRLAGGIGLVDDSYNASPVAVASMLDLLAETPGRRVAVLGEMLELGELTETAHAEAGRHAAEGVDVLIAVGSEHAAAMAEAARGAGLPAASVVVVSNTTEAIDTVPTLLRPGDVVLVKGSRRVALERLVDVLIAERGGR